MKMKIKHILWDAVIAVLRGILNAYIMKEKYLNSIILAFTKENKNKLKKINLKINLKKINLKQAKGRT